MFFFSPKKISASKIRLTVQFCFEEQQNMRQQRIVLQHNRNLQPVELRREENWLKATHLSSEPRQRSPCHQWTARRRLLSTDTSVLCDAV